MKVFGRVFRPPSEAYSLIVQTTVGCSHNKCRFCDMYKEKRFFIRDPDEVADELRELSEFYPDVRRIFLGDGDALIMKTGDLLKILNTVNENFTENPRVTCYATPKSILIKSPEELKQLKENGLDMVYLGLESGDDEVLELMDKGASSEELIEAGKRVREAGIKLSVTAISGLGGKKLWREHALNTAKVVSKINPEYFALLTLRAEGQAPLVEDIQNGRFEMLSPDEIMRETKLLLENTDSPGTVFRSNHISNYVNLAGTLNEDKDKLIDTIDKALEKGAYKSEELRYWDVNHL